MQLEEQFYELDRVKLKRWFPWLHLFRAFRLAIHPRCLLLGCAAILLLDAGREIVERLPFATDWADAYNGDRSVHIAGHAIEDLAVSWSDAFNRPLETIRRATDRGRIVLAPSVGHAEATRYLFAPSTGIPGFTTAVTLLLLYLIVWSICGVGIARMVATRFAAETSTRLRETVGYSFRKMGSSTGSAIVPLLAVITLWAISATLGLLGHIPGIGEIIVGLGWGVALLCGFAMAIILLGLAAGWPLMLCSVAVEDADAFDAFSRIYNYLFARPWYSLWLFILTLLYGSAVITFAATLMQTTHGLAEWAVSAGRGHHGLIQILDSPGRPPGFATTAVEVWRNIAGLILHGFVVSYFWTAATIVYFLLRKCEDATPLDAVTLPRTVAPEGAEDLPLVGMPATELRESESNANSNVDASNSDASDEAAPPEPE